MAPSRTSHLHRFCDASSVRRARRAPLGDGAHSVDDAANNICRRLRDISGYVRRGKWVVTSCWSARAGASTRWRGSSRRARCASAIIVAPGNPGIAARGEDARACRSRPTPCPSWWPLARASARTWWCAAPRRRWPRGWATPMRAAGMRVLRPVARRRRDRGLEGLRQAADGATPACRPRRSASSTTSPRPTRSSTRSRAPVVVKADGLAAGKGVVVTVDAGRGEGGRARDAGRPRLRRRRRARGHRGAAHRPRGLDDGAVRRRRASRCCAPSEDHKAVGDGDVGPEHRRHGDATRRRALVDDALTQRIVETIFVPTVRALAAAGRPFRGLLYGGLMLTPDRGPMVIEWNCRFGDPETQSVLVRMEDDLLPVAGRRRARARCPPAQPRWRARRRACAWCWRRPATRRKPRAGDAIAGAAGLDAAERRAGVPRGHAPVDARRRPGAAGDVGRARAGRHRARRRSRRRRARARTARSRGIHFAGMHFRRDIGCARRDDDHERNEQGERRRRRS